MTTATICPEILICDENIQPEVFDKLCMAVVASHIKNCKSLDLRIEICREIIESVIKKFPWQNIIDPNWKQFLNDWWRGVIHDLDRFSSSNMLPIDEEDNSITTITCVTNHQICKQCIFRKWLEKWKNGYIYKDRYIKGIGSNVNCSSVYSSSLKLCICSEFYVITDYIEWKYIKYPWLLFYDKKLPVKGEYPFQPQRNWKTLNSAPKGPGHGFLDTSGNEWCWDSSHNDHWDVQLKTSQYIKVNQDGQIL